MERSFRQAYNEVYTPELYKRYLGAIEQAVGCTVPFRVAETPLFLSAALRRRLSKAAREIVAQISDRAIIDKGLAAIPAELNVPGMDSLPGCVQVDFALCEDAQGELEGKVVELQAFPSLYALMVLQTDIMSQTLAPYPALARNWSMYYSGHTRESFLAKFREALIAGNAPEEVVLMDLSPKDQKTYPDFIATEMFTGVESVDPRELRKEGRNLYRTRAGKPQLVKRIYNRVVFDELQKLGGELPFRWTDDLDVTWVCHPNWYWVWSKHTLPSITHPAVPRARTVADFDAHEGVPKDLSNYVLKPLFSFAGSGVNINPAQADIDKLAGEERTGYILQEKITYAPALNMPTGEGVKAEIRMMFLRAPGDEKPELVLNLVRLSRGAMLGVDQNKNFDWVGGSIGIWPQEDAID